MKNELEISKPSSLFPAPAEWTMLKEQASIVLKSGFLPKDINTPEKAIAIALKGRELGIPPMHAFAHINIINGKPAISAELMLALIFKNCSGAVINYLESSTSRCEIETKRPGSKPMRFSFSIEEAGQAGLLNKGPWRMYPAAMLRARTVSIVARAVYPDAIMGCSYTPEELGAEVDEDGRVVSLPPETETQKPAPKAVQSEQASAPQAAAKAAPEPEKKKVINRADLAAQILEVGRALGMPDADVFSWAHEKYGKPANKLSIPEMEDFLKTLQEEAGRAGIVA
jgi:hypothetical protein